MSQFFKKIILKIQNIHFLSLAGNGIMSVLGMVIMAILYRFLPVKEIGIWVFFQSILLLVDTFRSGFITTAFIKFYAGSSPQRAAEVMGSTWYIGLSITAIFILLNIPAFLLLKYIHNEGFSLFLKWFGISYLLTLPSFLATCVLQAEQRFDRLLYIRFISQGLFIVLILISIFFNKINLYTVIYANLISSFTTSAFAILKGWSRIQTFGKRTTSSIKELFHFGKYSVGTTISANFFKSADTFIINFMLGPAALAVYNIGQRLMEIIEIPLRSFAATGMPSLSAAYNQNNKEEVINLMRRYIGMLTVALVPIALFSVVFADIAVVVIGGEKYANTEAANVFRLFMTFALLYPADRFMALTLDVIHKPRINFIKVLVMVAANIAGDFAGIYVLGNIYGVAITTIIPTLIAVLVGYFALQKYQPFNFTDIYRYGFTELKLLITQNFQKKKALSI